MFLGAKTKDQHKRVTFLHKPLALQSSLELISTHILDLADKAERNWRSLKKKPEEKANDTTEKRSTGNIKNLK
jgi:hypothetical protein